MGIEQAPDLMVIIVGLDIKRVESIRSHRTLYINGQKRTQCVRNSKSVLLNMFHKKEGCIEQFLNHLICKEVGD